MKTTTCLFFLLLSLQAKAQSAVETQFGGANFLGASVNLAYKIPIGASENSSLTPAFGLGMLAPGWQGPGGIIHAGLNYRYKNWGAGAELSWFKELPALGDNYHPEGVDMIVYPNVNYTFPICRSWYLKLSGGAYFAFSERTGPDGRNANLRFEGDVIPGGGISAGYTF